MDIAIRMLQQYVPGVRYSTVFPLIGFQMHSLEVQQHMQYLSLFEKYNTLIIFHVTTMYKYYWKCYLFNLD